MSIQLTNAEHLAMTATADIWSPPPPVDYEKWAVENITFSSRESQFPGPYNPDLFPYFSEILKALGPDDPCRIVTLKGSAQIGKTVLANVFTLGSQDLDPCDFLFVHPTEDNARRWSRLKLQPMLKSTTSLAALFPSRPRDGGDSVFYKERVDGRGSILISGANSPSSLSQVSMRRQVQDDLSKWEINMAGDPENQANSRSRGFEFAKIFKLSTPLIKPGCRITDNYDAGSQEVCELPCPHCGEYQTLEWENMLANLDEDAPEKAHFTCVACGCEIQEYHRPEMLRTRRWVANNPKAMREHRSFSIWSAYSLLQSFERIAREWLAAKGDPAKEQVFTNDTVGREYEVKGDAPPWEELRDRADSSDYSRGQIPAGGLLLVLGLDCQKDRVEWQLVAFGRDFRRWVVDVGVVDGHISEKKAQKSLTELLSFTWRNQAGQDRPIDLAAIDGNAWTEEVWDWAKKHPASKLIMVRGANTEQAPLLARVKKERNRKTGKLLRYSRRFYNFGASVLKMALYRNVKKTDPGERGYVGFPKGLEDEYFRQVTAERRIPVKRRDGFIVHNWVKDPNQANEALDTMLQAEAAAIKLGCRTMHDTQWDKLEAERETPPEEAQLDFEDMPLAKSAEAPAKAKEKPKAKSRPRTRRKRGWMK